MHPDAKHQVGSSRLELSYSLTRFDDKYDVRGFLTNVIQGTHKRPRSPEGHGSSADPEDH